MTVLTTPATNSAAFSARSSTHDSEKNNGKSILISELGKKQCHIKNQCWKFHGRPPGGKKRSTNDKQISGRAYMGESTRTFQPFNLTVNQIGLILPSTLRAIAQLGMPQFLSFISVDGKNPWVLGSGATDHLTSSSENFVSYIPCVGNEKIII